MKKLFKLITTLSLAFVITGCVSSGGDKHVCPVSTRDILDCSQYVDGVCIASEEVLYKFEWETDEEDDYEDLPDIPAPQVTCNYIITLQDDLGKIYKFYIPKKNDRYMFITEFYRSNYVGESLRIFYYGNYDENNLYSAKVNGLASTSIDNEIYQETIDNLNHETLEKYDSCTDITICCPEKAILTVADYLGIKDLERVVTKNDYVYYKKDNMGIYCNNISITNKDTIEYYIVVYSAESGYEDYMVNMETGEAKTYQQWLFGT